MPWAAPAFHSADNHQEALWWFPWATQPMELLVDSAAAGVAGAAGK
jgi:hypothetical protein